jgi:hypothetical protein
MALTPEQQSNLDFQNAINEITTQQQLALESARHANQLAAQSKQAKLEAVRLAKEVLIENARSKAVDSRDVAAADIATFAQTLVAYIDA